jgi:hypothetical protein
MRSRGRGGDGQAAILHGAIRTYQELKIKAAPASGWKIAEQAASVIPGKAGIHELGCASCPATALIDRIKSRMTWIR